MNSLIFWRVHRTLAGKSWTRQKLEFGEFNRYPYFYISKDFQRPMTILNVIFVWEILTIWYRSCIFYLKESVHLTGARLGPDAMMNVRVVGRHYFFWAVTLQNEKVTAQIRSNENLIQMEL